MNSIQAYSNLLEEVAAGTPAAAAVEALPVEDYDRLIEAGYCLDDFLLTADQQKVALQIKREPRPVFPDGYQKKYPAEKIELYNALINFLEKLEGVAAVTQPAKANYRDVFFKYKNVYFCITLSIPRRARNK